MIDENFIKDRITQLRMNKDVSEYQMSLELGHSKSYIQAISSGRALPSMSEFLAICEYLGVTPKDFFDEDIPDPYLVSEALEALKPLKREQLKLLIAVAKEMK